MQSTQSSVERRCEERQPTQVACTITALGQCEKQRSVACIVDWSSCGIALVTTHRLGIGSSVAVEYAGVVVVAEVRNCIPDQRAFRIGLRICEGVARENARLSVGGAVREIQARIEEYEALVA